MKKFLAYALPVIIVMGLIFYISSQSYIPEPTLTGRNTETRAISYHFLSFLLLAFLSRRCFKSYNIKNIYLTFFFVLIYSALDEFHQLFVPGRNFDIKDLFIDNIGSLLLLSKDIIKQKRKKQQQ